MGSPELRGINLSVPLRQPRLIHYGKLFENTADRAAVLFGKLLN